MSISFGKLSLDGGEGSQPSPIITPGDDSPFGPEVRFRGEFEEDAPSDGPAFNMADPFGTTSTQSAEAASKVQLDGKEYSVEELSELLAKNSEVQTKLGELEAAHKTFEPIQAFLAGLDDTQMKALTALTDHFERTNQGLPSELPDLVSLLGQQGAAQLVPEIDVDNLSAEGRSIHDAYSKAMTAQNAQLAKLQGLVEQQSATIKELTSALPSLKEASAAVLGDRQAQAAAESLSAKLGLKVDPADVRAAATAQKTNDLEGAFLKENAAKLVSGAYKAGRATSDSEVPPTPRVGNGRPLTKNDYKTLTADQIMDGFRRGIFVKE